MAIVYNPAKPQAHSIKIVRDLQYIPVSYSVIKCLKFYTYTTVVCTSVCQLWSLLWRLAKLARTPAFILGLEAPAALGGVKHPGCPNEANTYVISQRFRWMASLVMMAIFLTLKKGHQPKNGLNTKKPCKYYCILLYSFEKDWKGMKRPSTLLHVGLRVSWDSSFQSHFSHLFVAVPSHVIRLRKSGIWPRSWLVLY